MNALAERLRDYWSSIGAGQRPGVSQETVKSFESKHGVLLPEDFSQYILTVDGLMEGGWDNEMISFWPLQSINSVPEVLSDFAGIPDYSQIGTHLSVASSYFVFADFLIWSHVYAIRLNSSPAEKSQILWLCGSEHHLIAESFSDFLQMYLENPASVLCPEN